MIFHIYYAHIITLPHLIFRARIVRRLKRVYFETCVFKECRFLKFCYLFRLHTPHTEWFSACHRTSRVLFPLLLSNILSRLHGEARSSWAGWGTLIGAVLKRSSLPLSRPMGKSTWMHAQWNANWFRLLLAEYRTGRLPSMPILIMSGRCYEICKHGSRNVFPLCPSARSCPIVFESKTPTRSIRPTSVHCRVFFSKIKRFVS